MKIVNPEGITLTFSENFSLVSKETSPFKEIIQRKDFSKFVFSDVEEIPLSDTTQIQVNIIDVGVMIYLFKTNEFQKEKFIEDVSKLKELQLNSFYDVLNKVKTLFQVTETFNPLFAIYNPAGKWKILEECFKTITTNIKIFYISESESSAVVSKSEPTYVASSYNTEKPSEPKEKAKFKFTNPMPIITKDKFHFLFALIATLLIGFTAAIGIYDAYAGKLICIFFFICSAAGAFLNFMIYKDTYKSNSFKSMYSLLTIGSSLVGIAIGSGFYFLFKMITTEKAAVEPKFILILFIMVIVSVISGVIGYLFNFLKKRKK